MVCIKVSLKCYYTGVINVLLTCYYNGVRKVSLKCYDNGVNKRVILNVILMVCIIVIFKMLL